MRRLLLLAALLVLGAAAPLQAADVVGSYRAYIGDSDLYNSKGKRLSEVWQVLRQDRANVHRYRIRQPGDEDDPFFSSVANREALERMLRANPPDRRTASAILRGNVMVEVLLLGRNGRADSLAVRLLN